MGFQRLIACVDQEVWVPREVDLSQSNDHILNCTYQGLACQDLPAFPQEGGKQ